MLIIKREILNIMNSTKSINSRIKNLVDLIRQLFLNYNYELFLNYREIKK